MLEALFYIAQMANMPALSYKLAGNQGMYLGLSHLSYPVLIVNIDEYIIDPALLLAFMRRESNFFSGANSGPGARGLMQILPQTASLIVNQNMDLSVSQNYTQNSLYSPKVSVTLGQKYIQTLIQNPEINGNLVYTTMGYNAGFHRAKTWLNEAHRKVEDPLFFIESIPFYETRAYVKSVITDYWIYQYKIGFNTYSLKLLSRNIYPFYYQPSNDDFENAKNFSYLKYNKKP